MTADALLHAWVDESVHEARGLYVLAAAIAPAGEAELEEHRRALRDLRRHARPRLHWHVEEGRDRIAIVRAIAEMSLLNVVVTATGMERSNQERARRKCLERMLYTLAANGVRHVWLEARDPAGNARDLLMVRALRTQRAIPTSIQVDFDRPMDEPMLWIPDAVAGAVAAAHHGNIRYRPTIDHLIDEQVVEI